MLCFCDEVGVASIAGPVLVCALAVENNHPRIEGVKDSKKLTKKKREELYDIITSQVEYAFGSASPNKIEKLNIHYARYEAMRIAVERLIRRGVKIEKVIVDGKFTIPNLNVEQEAVIKADDKFWECGAASILAKVKRDGLMAKLGELEKYSYYAWDSNAGYFSPQHRDGIIKHGITTLHRVNFEYTKYCVACYEKSLELGGYEKFLEYEKEQVEKYKMSYFQIWKNNKKQIWKEIKYGEIFNGDNSILD